MFRKLLKYDFRAIGRIWWIAALGMLGISVMGGFSLGDIIIHADNVDYFPIGIFGILLTYFGFVAFSIVSWILLFVRYYKNFFTDEGYLTFTLPVTRTQLYLSKTVNAMIWNALTMIVIFIGVIIILCIAPSGAEGGQRVLGYLFDELSKAEIPSFVSMGVGAWPFVWFSEALVIIILSSLTSVMFIELCITVGSIIAKKAKVMVAIALAYGTSILFSVGYSIVSFLLPFWIASASERFPGAFAAGTSLYGLVSLGLLLVCVILAIAVEALYLITVTCLERKLNLA